MLDHDVLTPPPIASATRYRLMLVDDHAVCREGIAAVLSRETDLDVVAEAADEALALERAREARPDAIVVDLSLGEGSGGLALIQALRRTLPDARILVLSMHDERVYAERALRAGADGYLMKHEGTARLVAALRTILDRRTYVSSVVSAGIVAGLRGAVPRESAARLSDRQLEVFRLFGQGLGTKEVAARLGLSVKTIETHRATIKRRLSLQGASELVAYAATWVARHPEAAPSASRSTRPPRKARASNAPAARRR